MAILSSQTRWDKVASFLASGPAALDIESPAVQLADLALELKERGIRFPNNKARYLEAARLYLDDGGWSEIESDAHTLRHGLSLNEAAAISIEREMANRLARRFAGISHKQARNVWINLGLFRFEFPLDSRWMAFLRSTGWDVPIGNLQRLSYYLSVENQVQAVAHEAGVLPAILDAVVFAHMEAVESLPSA